MVLRGDRGRTRAASRSSSRSLPDEGFAGVNVTVPHKLAALAAGRLRSRRRRRRSAPRTRSASTAHRSPPRTPTRSGSPARSASPVDGKRALVLGAGGSARAAVYALRNAGADVSIWNRTAARAQVPGRGIRRRAERRVDERRARPTSTSLLNATTLGLGQASARPTDIRGPKAVSVHCRFTLRTTSRGGPGLRAARDRARDRSKAAGRRVIDGLEVLVHQGAASLRIWTGLEPPLETMRAAARES